MCPVCGSVHHPELARIPSEAITEEAFKKLKETEDKLQSKKSEANTSAETAKTALAEYEDRLKTDILECLENKLIDISNKDGDPDELIKKVIDARKIIDDRNKENNIKQLSLEKDSIRLTEAEIKLDEAQGVKSEKLVLDKEEFTKRKQETEKLKAEKEAVFSTLAKLSFDSWEASKNELDKAYEKKKNIIYLIEKCDAANKNAEKNLASMKSALETLEKTILNERRSEAERKLKLEEAQSEADLVDGGLRYDLTVPLVRYFAAHQNELPMPFKALQMGNVWRADRPQKGRYRQFMQCDIDIIGEPSNLAEIELILATTTTLGNLGFKNFQIRINERRILKAMAAYSGFPEDRYTDVFIILDKMDKIGLDGAAQELIDEGFTEEMRDRYVSLFEGLQDAQDQLAYLEEKLEGFIEPDVIPTLREVMESVDGTKTADFRIVFDPTIVRGMSYYTGTIFEIAMPELGISCGGGGRYDGMVGKFTGKDVPACGFSIGFERIILILMEQGFKIPGSPVKKAYLIEKNMPAERLCEVIRQAQKERAEGTQVLIARMAKNKKFQKQQMAERGFEQFEEFYRNPINK